MNSKNMNQIITYIISGINWEFVISCYGEEEHKLKYIVETTVEKDNKTIKTYKYVKPTIELLQKDLIDLLVLVINKNYQIFYYGHWTIRQIPGFDSKDNYGDSIEVMFTPCRFTVVEEKKHSKENRKNINSSQHFRSAFKNRSTNMIKFDTLLKKEKDTFMLDEMLRNCLDPKNEDYETAAKLRNRLLELKK